MDLPGHSKAPGLFETPSVEFHTPPFSDKIEYYGIRQDARRVRTSFLIWWIENRFEML
jgi:hypothetical protein